MYKIYCDDYPILNADFPDLKVIDAELIREVNTSGTLKFILSCEHPYYNNINKMTSIITVFKDNTEIWRGRAIEENFDFENRKEVICEGDLSVLNDTIIRPFILEEKTISELLTYLITQHNAYVETNKQFLLGNVTIRDTTTYNWASEEYTNTFTLIKNKLLDVYGGYIRTRQDGTTKYLDYLEDSTIISEQAIEFGENLIDYAKNSSVTDVITALIPLGASDSETNEKLTIVDVNDGLDYITNTTAVDTFGMITAVQEFSDITDAQELKTAGETYLANNMLQNIEFELSAYDLSNIDANIDDFNFFEYVQCTSEPHNFDENLLIKKQTLNLLDSTGNIIELGHTIKTFTDTQQNTDKKINNIINTINTVVNNVNKNIATATEYNTSLINQTAEEILNSVSETYVTSDGLTEAIETRLVQTANEITMLWNSLTTLQTDTDTQFTEINKYIRFVDGKIILGETDSDFTLEISNTRISFLQNSAEVAYISAKKLYITNAQILNTLQNGNFEITNGDAGEFIIQNAG